MIVVDTNVLAYLLLPYELSVHADALYERDPEWAAPIFWRSEFRNLLGGYLRRKALTTAADKTKSNQTRKKAQDLLKAIP